MRNAARRWSVRSSWFVLVSLLALLTVTPALADWGQPRAITDEAKTMSTLFKIVTSIAIVVFLGVEGAVLYAVVKFRKKGDSLPPQTHGNNLLEIVWTTIPIVIVLVLFVASFVVLVDVEHGHNDDDLTVDVQGFQFQWQFTYHPNDLGKTSDPNLKLDKDVVVLGTAKDEPTLVIPVGERVEFKLLSKDVIHSFYVRNFLYKLDVIPGRDNAFSVTAKETGDFIGQCAELCGTNHALMRFHLRVVERAEFDKCLTNMAACAVTPEAAVQKP